MEKESNFTQATLAVLVGLICLSGNDIAVANDIVWPKDCPQQAAADERVTPIRDKLPSVISAPTLQQLADHTRPTREQKKAVLAYDEARSRCETEMSDGYRSDAASAFAKYAATSKKLRASLYSGAIDYAAFVSSDQENLEVFNNALDEISSHETQSRTDQQNSQEQATFQQRRQQEILNQQAQLLAIQQQQFDDERNRREIQDLTKSMRDLGDSFRRSAPVVTNCYSAYGSTSCTTY